MFCIICFKAIFLIFTHMLQETFGVYNDLRKDEVSEPNIFYVMITGGGCKTKTRHDTL